MALITVTPNPSLDRFCAPERLAIGGLNRLGSVVTRAGGKGINVARAARAAGQRSFIIAAAGGYTGEILGELLRAEQLEYEFVPVAGETRINLKISCGGQSTELNEAGPTADASTLSELCARLESRASEGGVVALCGSLSPGMPRDAYAQLICAARSRGAIAALDADGNALRLGLEAEPDLIKPNADELAALFGETYTGVQQLRELAQRIVNERMARAVLCSMGAQGAFYLSRGVFFAAPAPPVCRVVSTVGAGDALLGGFLAARMRELAPEAALHAALEAARAHISTFEEEQSCKETQR